MCLTIYILSVCISVCVHMCYMWVYIYMWICTCSCVYTWPYIGTSICACVCTCIFSCSLHGKKQHGIVGFGHLGFVSWLSCVAVLSLSKGYLTSPCLSFLICTIGVLKYLFWSNVKEIKWIDVQSFWEGIAHKYYISVAFAISLTNSILFKRIEYVVIIYSNVHSSN